MWVSKSPSFDLGLAPFAPPQGPITYWGVPNVDEAYATLLASGAKPLEKGEVHDVGNNIHPPCLQSSTLRVFIFAQWGWKPSLQVVGPQYIGQNPGPGL